ncbi:Nodulation protein NolO |nr:Nodulation protein NolO \
MLILSVCHGGHDSSAVVANDYEILAAVQTERITRKKGDGKYAHLPTINAALRAAGANASDVETFAMSHGRAPSRYFCWDFWQKMRYGVARIIGKERQKLILQNRDIFNQEKLLHDIGLPKNSEFCFYNHHFSHALSALFFTDWNNALLYTADGGGDTTNYSAYHFDGATIHELYGDLKNANAKFPADSIGFAYGAMTRALGYQRNRHEGKLTGLAAFGEPTIYDELAQHFSVDETGRVRTKFKKQYEEMVPLITKIAQTTARENAAASIQKLLEEIILKSVSIYLERTGVRHIGLAGGVFANVSLNRKIGELPQVDEVFVFPAMGDEGIAVGGLYQYLLERDGLAVWQNKRRRLKNVYWGGTFDDDIKKIFNRTTKRVDGETASVAAKLLADNKIVALYCGRMEFGPRALGGRSILAAATNKEINDTLNKRLQRTEFMPFAPVVLAEDAAEIFEINDKNKYAMRFMTITCRVREQWHKKIPAVVHVDGTARPQIIYDEDNPLYATILREYKKQTGLPVLINTSFNAHEEPIIHTPEECLRALQAGRVDYVVTQNGVYVA